MNGEQRMPRTNAARYGLIAVVISILFVTVYTTLEFLEQHVAAAFGVFIASTGPRYWLVWTMPATLTLLAYWAGRQRDRVAVYARDREALHLILRSLVYAPDPDLDQTLPQVLQHIAEALDVAEAVVLVRQHEEWIMRAATRGVPETTASLARVPAWPPTALTPITLNLDQTTAP